MAPWPLRGDRRNQRPSILLGAGASNGQGGFPSFRLLCARIAPGLTTMKFGIDRLIAEPALRASLSGRRVALLAHPASVTQDLTHSLDALAGCDDIKLVAA